jgi:hypothetical protein
MYNFCYVTEQARKLVHRICNFLKKHSLTYSDNLHYMYRVIWDIYETKIQCRYILTESTNVHGKATYSLWQAAHSSLTLENFWQTT